MHNKNEATQSTAVPGRKLVDETLRSDPFARLLGRLGIRPAVFGLLVLAYGLVRTLLLPAIFGHLRTVQVGGVVILGVLDDWPVLVVELIMVPVIAGYYLWQPSTMQAVYDGIAVRLGQKAGVTSAMMEFPRLLGWPGWGVVALLIGLLEAGYAVFLFRGYTVATWETANPQMLITVEVVRLLTFYCLIFVVSRQVLMIIGLNRFFSDFSVEIAPLHPDKAGGLRILGDYVLTTGLIIAAVGLNFGMGLLRQRLNPGVLTAEFYVSMILYFIIAPLVFFLPLIQVHRQMDAARTKLLAEVAEQFDLEYKKLLEGLRRNELESGGVARLETIQKIYQIADDSPVWPFDLAIISKFTAATLLPVLLPFLAEALSRLFTR